MTIGEFGRTIKQKYPQYKDLSDEEVGQKMITRYPQYNDIVQKDKKQEVSTFLEGHSVLKGIGDIIGVTGLGKGISQSIFLNFTPEGKNTLKLLEEGKITKDEFDNILGGGLATTREIVGSAVQTGATLASVGLAAPKAASVAGRIAETGAKFGGLSALSGGAEAFGRGAGVEEITKQAATSGAIGTGFGVAGQAISELATYLTSSAVTEGIYNKALGLPKKVVEQGKSPSKMLLEKGISGSKKSILARSQEIANSSETKIQKILESTGPGNFVSSNIQSEIRNQLRSKFANTLSDSEIDTIVEKLPLNILKKKYSVSPAELNKLRREIDNNFLGNAKWLNESTAEKTVALKTATNVMREMVQGVDKRLPGIFNEYSKAITGVRSLRSELAKPHILSNLLEILTSLTVGGATGGLTPEGLRNALVTFAGINAAQSAPVKTGIAKTLFKAGQASKGVIPQTAKTLIKGTVPGVSSELSNF